MPDQQQPDEGAAPAAAVTPVVIPLDNPDALLTAALAGAQGEFPAIDKRHTATVAAKPGKTGYSYSYADLADVLGAVRPVLSRHGLAIVQTTRPGDRGTELVTELRHVGGGRIESLVDLGQSSGNPQAFGGALTYLRRYEAVTILGIAAEEDRDAQDVPVAGERPAVEVPPRWAAEANREQKAALRTVLLELVGDQAVADEYARALAREAGGKVPGVVAWWLGTLGDWRDRAAAAPAERAAAAQDAAAEQPDPPAPDELPVIPPAEELATMYRDKLAELARAHRLDVGPQPSKAGLILALEQHATAAAAAAPDEEEDPGPTAEELATPAEHPAVPSGSVENPFPEGAELDEEAIAQLRELGCICPDPTVPVGRMDECPIAGHGIPY